MLPPRNTDAGEAVSGEDLGEYVHLFAYDDLGVTRIVAEPPALNLEKTHQYTETLMNPATIGAQDTVDAQSKQHCHQKQREMDVVSTVFEEPHFHKLTAGMVVGPIKDVVERVMGSGEGDGCVGREEGRRGGAPWERGAN
ncbi:hypothetical protein ACFX12_034421 [Malus domestica]